MCNCFWEACHCREAEMLLQLRLLQESRSATMEEVTAVHDADYIQQLKDTADNKAPTVVADFDDPDGFTYMTSTSFDDALKVTVPSSFCNQGVHVAKQPWMHACPKVIQAKPEQVYLLATGSMTFAS